MVIFFLVMLMLKKIAVYFYQMVNIIQMAKYQYFLQKTNEIGINGLKNKKLKLLKLGVNFVKKTINRFV